VLLMYWDSGRLWLHSVLARDHIDTSVRGCRVFVCPLGQLRVAHTCMQGYLLSGISEVCVIAGDRLVMRFSSSSGKQLEGNFGIF